MEPGRGGPPGAALDHGAALAARLLAGNPDVHVRQVHCPASRGALGRRDGDVRGALARLPAAYARFLADRLEPGAPVLLLHDARTWPVRDDGPGTASRSAPRPAAWTRWTSTRTRTPCARCSARPAATGRAGSRRRSPPRARTPSTAWSPGSSTAPGPGPAGAGIRCTGCSSRSRTRSARSTADLYRRWLRRAGKTGDRLVVECGRLLDPWQVLRAGLVPYWCENATRRRVEGVEWWLAGSEPFSSVDVLPEPPGLRSTGAGRTAAVAGGGGVRASPAGAGPGRRPGLSGRLGTHPTCHRGVAQPAVRPARSPPPLRVAEALAALRDAAPTRGCWSADVGPPPGDRAAGQPGETSSRTCGP